MIWTTNARLTRAFLAGSDATYIIGQHVVRLTTMQRRWLTQGRSLESHGYRASWPRQDAVTPFNMRTVWSALSPLNILPQLTHGISAVSSFIYATQRTLRKEHNVHNKWPMTWLEFVTWYGLCQIKGVFLDFAWLA